MDEDTKRAIYNFLKEFKRIGTQGRGIDIVNRRKNLAALSKLGLTKQNCKEEILSLSVSDYFRGPEPDIDRPGEVWEFGKVIQGKEIYVKLKIFRGGKIRLAKCISFHASEFPICFPFKGGAEEGGEET